MTSVTALLLDTHSLFFRAHHALPPMSTQAGEPTAALYGLSALLLKLLREVRPSGVAFARDLPQLTFRHAEYTEYKGGRPPAPDALRSQWGRLEELIAAFGVPSHARPGFEADDVLATLARRLAAAGEPVVVVSGDRVLFQTIGPRVKVLFVGARGQKPESFDEAAIAARFGVAPSSLPLISALVGEAADNLEGVRGIGARTASKLAAQYGTAEALLGDLDRVAPPKIQEALRGARDRLALNARLATLHDDLELDEPLVGPVTPAALTAVEVVFERLEFKSLVPRVAALRARG